MAKHFNLYHLLLEDQQRNPMDPDARDQVQKNIEEFYKKISEVLTPEERLFILKSLKNKCCENCTNGSCNVEYHEKLGLMYDKDNNI